MRNFRQQIITGKLERLNNLPNISRDFYSLSEFRDLCFHVQEERFTTKSLQKLLDDENLEFCGFMLPKKVKEAYQQRFPKDNDCLSLDGWGEFEEIFPSTFQGMYQFWAYKPQTNS